MSLSGVRSRRTAVLGSTANRWLFSSPVSSLMNSTWRLSWLHICHWIGRPLVRVSGWAALMLSLGDSQTFITPSHGASHESHRPSGEIFAPMALGLSNNLRRGMSWSSDIRVSNCSKFLEVVKPEQAVYHQIKALHPLPNGARGRWDHLPADLSFPLPVGERDRVSGLSQATGFAKLSYFTTTRPSILAAMWPCFLANTITSLANSSADSGPRTTSAALIAA